MAAQTSYKQVSSPSNNETMYVGEDLQQIYKIEPILNAKDEPIERKIKALLLTWDRLASLSSCPSRENLRTLTEYLKSHTLNIVLSATWLKLRDKYGDRLVQGINQCSEQFRCFRGFQTLCTKLASIAKVPWQHPTMLRLINDTNPVPTEEDYNFFVHEESAYFISKRLTVLCEDRCEDLALNLTRAYMRLCEWAKQLEKLMYISSDQKKFITDVYLALLYNREHIDEMSTMLKHLPLPDGVDMVHRFSLKVHVTRIWHLSGPIARLAGTVFLTRAVMIPYDANSTVLGDLLDIWLPIYDLDPDRDELFACLRRIMQYAIESLHMYYIARKLVRRYGVVLRPYSVEVYIQSLNTDLNILEKLKTETENVADKISAVMAQLARGLMELGALLEENTKVSRECVLSSFSLNPNDESLRQVEEMARMSGYEVLDTGQWKCDHPPATTIADLQILCDLCGQYKDHLIIKTELQQPNLELSEALLANDMGLNSTIKDDLIVVIFCYRYHLMSWQQNWADLHRLCVMYRKDPVKTKNFITELKHIDLDYGRFLQKRQEARERDAKEREQLEAKEILERKRSRGRPQKKRRRKDSDEDYDVPSQNNNDPESERTVKSFRKELRKKAARGRPTIVSGGSHEPYPPSLSCLTATFNPPSTDLSLANELVDESIYDPCIDPFLYTYCQSKIVPTVDVYNSNFSEQPVIRQSPVAPSSTLNSAEHIVDHSNSSSNGDDTNNRQANAPEGRLPNGMVVDDDVQPSHDRSDLSNAPCETSQPLYNLSSWETDPPPDPPDCPLSGDVGRSPIELDVRQPPSEIILSAHQQPFQPLYKQSVWVTEPPPSPPDYSPSDEMFNRTEDNTQNHTIQSPLHQSIRDSPEIIQPAHHQSESNVESINIEHSIRIEEDILTCVIHHNASGHDTIEYSMEHNVEAISHHQSIRNNRDSLTDAIPSSHHWSSWESPQSPLNQDIGDTPEARIDDQRQSHYRSSCDYWRYPEIIRDSPESPQAQTTRDSPESPQNQTIRDSPESPQNQTIRDSPESPQNQTTRDSPESPQNQTIRDSPESPQAQTIRDSPESPQAQTIRDSPESPQAQTIRDSPESPQAQTIRDSPESPSEQTIRDSPESPVNQNIRDSPESPQNQIITDRRTVEKIHSDVGAVVPTNNYSSNESERQQLRPKRNGSQYDLNGEDTLTERVLPIVNGWESKSVVHSLCQIYELIDNRRTDKSTVEIPQLQTFRPVDNSKKVHAPRQIYRPIDHRIADESGAEETRRQTCRPTDNSSGHESNVDAPHQISQLINNQRNVESDGKDQTFRPTHTPSEISQPIDKTRTDESDGDGQPRLTIGPTDNDSGYESNIHSLPQICRPIGNRIADESELHRNECESDGETFQPTHNGSGYESNQVSDVSELPQNPQSTHNQSDSESDGEDILSQTFQQTDNGSGYESNLESSRKTSRSIVDRSDSDTQDSDTHSQTFQPIDNGSGYESDSGLVDQRCPRPTSIQSVCESDVGVVRHKTYPSVYDYNYSWKQLLPPSTPSEPLRLHKKLSELKIDDDMARSPTNNQSSRENVMDVNPPQQTDWDTNMIDLHRPNQTGQQKCNDDDQLPDTPQSPTMITSPRSFKQIMVSFRASPQTLKPSCKVNNNIFQLPQRIMPTFKRENDWPSFPDSPESATPENESSSQMNVINPEPETLERSCTTREQVASPQIIEPDTLESRLPETIQHSLDMEIQAPHDPTSEETDVIDSPRQTIQPICRRRKSRKSKPVKLSQQSRDRSEWEPAIINLDAALKTSQQQLHNPDGVDLNPPSLTSHRSRLESDVIDCDSDNQRPIIKPALFNSVLEKHLDALASTSIKTIEPTVIDTEPKIRQSEDRGGWELTRVRFDQSQLTIKPIYSRQRQPTADSPESQSSPENKRSRGRLNKTPNVKHSNNYIVDDNKENPIIEISSDSEDSPQSSNEDTFQITPFGNGFVAAEVNRGKSSNVDDRMDIEDSVVPVQRVVGNDEEAMPEQRRTDHDVELDGNVHELLYDSPSSPDDENRTGDEGFPACTIVPEPVNNRGPIIYAQQVTSESNEESSSSEMPDMETIYDMFVPTERDSIVMDGNIDVAGLCSHVADRVHSSDGDKYTDDSKFSLENSSCSMERKTANCEEVLDKNSDITSKDLKSSNIDVQSDSDFRFVDSSIDNYLAENNDIEEEYISANGDIVTRYSTEAKAHELSSDSDSSENSDINASSQNIEYLKNKYSLKECSVVLNRVYEPVIVKIPKRVYKTRRRAPKRLSSSSVNLRSENVQSRRAKKKDENFNSQFYWPLQTKNKRAALSASNTDCILDDLKQKLLVNTDKMNPRVVLRRLDDSRVRSLLARVPGVSDTQLFRPDNTDRIVQVVQIAGGRATSTVQAPNTQTSTQVSPHIQRIGQPRIDKVEQASNVETTTVTKSSTNTYTITKPAATQSPTLINILSQQIIRPSPSNNNISRARPGPLINILSHQTIKTPATTAINKTTTVTSEAQANNPSRLLTPSSDQQQQILNQIVNPNRSAGSVKTVVDGKLIPVTSFPSNRLVKVGTTQGVTATATPDSPNADESFGKSTPSKKTEANEISEGLPKFQQAFGKSVYQNNVDSTNCTTNTTTNNVEGDKSKTVVKSTAVSVQPIQSGVIYTRQMPIGHTITFNPQTRGQVFRIATTNAEQISLVKDTVIHSKMSALLAAALQGKPKNSEIANDVESTTDATARVQLTRPTLSARIVKPVLQIPTNVIRNTPQPNANANTNANTNTNLSSTTLEQLREFDMVYKQVKERSSTSTPAESVAVSESSESSSPQRISVTYLNQGGQKINCAPVVVVSSYNNLQPAASPALSVASQSSSSPCVTPAPTPTPVLPKVAAKSSKGKSVKPAPVSTSSKTSPIPKPQQKPQEDEHTTQRIFDILAEYAEQLRNSPDLNNKPAPRRRSNPPTNPSQNSKRKKTSSSKKPGQCGSLSNDLDMEDPRTVGSEDSSCGVVQLSMQDDEQPPITTITSESNDSTVTTRQQLILTDSSHNQTRNLIIADSSVGEALKIPNTAVLVPGNYIMPVSMVKGGQQIAVVSGGSKILATVPARSGPNMLLFQSFLNQNRKTNVPTVKYSTIQPISGISSQSLTGVSAQPPVILPPPAHGISTVTLGQPIAIKKIEEGESGNTELLLTISQSRESNNPPAAAEDTPQPDSSTGVAPKTESVDLDESTAMSDHSEKTFTYQKTPNTAPIATPVIAQAIKEEEHTEPTTNASIMTLNLNPLDTKGESSKVERVKSVLVTAGSSNGPMLSHSPPQYKQSDCSTNSGQTKDGFLRISGKRNEKAQQGTGFGMQGRLKKTSSSGQQMSLQRRQAAMERELKLQKSLSEECEDLGVDEPSTSDLFPEALLFDSNNSPSFDQTHRPTQPQEKEENSKLTLFSDDDFMFEPGQYHGDNQLYEEVVDARLLSNRRGEAAAEDNTLLQTCTSMSDVTLCSPISPDPYHTHTPPPLNKYMHKYTNKKKQTDRLKQADNWPAEVSSSEDTTGSIEPMKCAGSPEICLNKRSDEEMSDGSFKVVRLSISKSGCSEVHCSKDKHCTLSGRGARKSVKKQCTCCSGVVNNSAASRKRSSSHTHTSNPHKKAFPNKKR